MIDKEAFINLIEAEFQVEDQQCVLSSSSQFKEEKIWSSMLALLVIVQITDHYGIILDDNDIKSVSTINDLYELVVKRKKDESSCPS